MSTNIKNNNTNQSKRMLSKIKLRHIKELSVYGIVGILALIMQIITYSYLLTTELLKYHPIIANIFANTVGMFVSYYGHTRFTFKKTHHFSHTEFIKFIITSLIGLMITSVGIYIIVNILKLNSQLGIVSMFFAPFITFMISKFWVFKDTKLHNK